MGRKINPLVFRSQTRNKEINWVTNEQNYRRLVREDKKIRDFIFNTAKKNNLDVNTVYIFRKQTKVNILLESIYIVILLAKNERIEEIDFTNFLKNNLDKALFKGQNVIHLKLIKAEEKQFIFNQFSELVKSIEFGGSIKLLLTRFLNDLSTIENIEGAKLEIYGRIDGSEKSRNLKLNYGALNLQTLDSKVHYLDKRIETKDGTLNLKFIYKIK